LNKVELKMNTKLAMSLSALVMGVAGIVFSFLPQEVLGYLGAIDVSRLDTTMLQLMGAMYFGFAMINWVAKGNLIGGIYGRPIAIGNLCHFVIAALALVKAYTSSQLSVLIVPTIIYVIFAIVFAVIFFTHPVKMGQK
jgi:Na+-driven multidrug efflux pump